MQHNPTPGRTAVRGLIASKRRRRRPETLSLMMATQGLQQQSSMHRDGLCITARGNLTYIPSLDTKMRFSPWRSQQAKGRQTLASRRTTLMVQTENAEEQSFQTNDFRAPIKQHCGSIGVKQPRPCYFACISCDSAVSSLSPSSLPKRQPSSVGTTPMVSDSVQQEQWKMLHTTPGVTAEWRRHVETAADIDNLDSKSLHTSVGSG